jgi:hypothetical protein
LTSKSSISAKKAVRMSIFTICEEENDGSDNEEEFNIERRQV